jgi:hypothetical protein
MKLEQYVKDGSILEQVRLIAFFYISALEVDENKILS